MPSAKLGAKIPNDRFIAISIITPTHTAKIANVTKAYLMLQL